MRHFFLIALKTANLMAVRTIFREPQGLAQPRSARNFALAVRLEQRCRKFGMRFPRRRAVAGVAIATQEARRVPGRPSKKRGEKIGAAA
jgi:hypothetical protein